MSSAGSVGLRVSRPRASAGDGSRVGCRIAPGSRSSHPLCGYEKCVYVLIVLVDAGGSVDAGDAGPPGVSSFGVATVARRSVVSVASREFCSMAVLGGQAPT